MARTVAFLFALCLSLAGLRAQILVENRLDSTEIVIGRQAHLTLKVTADAGTRIEFPRLKGQELVSGVEVVEIQPLDTAWANNQKRIILTQTYTITSFDSAFYSLPPMAVTVGGKRYAARRGLGLKVETVAVDTTKADRYFGPRGAVEGTFQWNVRWLLLSLLAVILFVGGIILLYRSRNKQPMVRRRVLPPPPLPHRTAAEQIEKIKAERTAQTDNKTYYMQLTDVLRAYIGKRFGFNAEQMTSEEIIDRLTQGNSEEVLDELRHIFNTADLVKFAKYETQLNENDANLLKAVAFINSTKIEPATPPKPIIEEVPMAQKRQMALRLGLLVGGIALIVATGVALYFVIDYFYNTFM